MNILRSLFLLALSLVLSPAICLGQNSGFDDLDTDSDGKVTKKEFQEYAKGRLPDFDELEKFADRVDADKDGAISEDEFDDRMDALQALSQEMLNGDDAPKKKTKEELEMVDEATKAFNAMAKLVSQGDWEKAPKRMTKKARDDYAMGLVTQSITLTKMELPPQMDTPAVNEAKDDTIDVLEKYELGDIDVSFFMKGGGGSADSSSDDDDDEMTPQEKAKAKQVERKAREDKLKTEIMTAIDKNDQRWEIVAALRDAQKGSSFHRDVFKGKVSDSAVDGDAVFLTVTQKAPEGAVAFPSVVKMTAQKGKWKYAGMDLPRTRKAMQQARQRPRGRRTPAEPDTDF